MRQAAWSFPCTNYGALRGRKCNRAPPHEQAGRGPSGRAGDGRALLPCFGHFGGLWVDRVQSLVPAAELPVGIVAGRGRGRRYRERAVTIHAIGRTITA